MRKGCDGLIQSMVRLYGGDLKLRFANGKLAADVEPQLALLTAGGLVSLQTASISLALPFSVLMLLMIAGLLKSLWAEK